jgi:hypothetical protein
VDAEVPDAQWPDAGVDAEVPDAQWHDAPLPDLVSKPDLCGCDDSITCTDNGCNDAGGCVFTLKSGYCLIGFTSCYKDGDVNPANPCQKCDVSQSQSSWTTFAGKGCVTTVAGGGSSYPCGYTGPALSANLQKLTGIAFNASTDEIYFAEAQCHQIHALYKNSAGQWRIYVIAGAVGPGYVGSTAGVATSTAKFSYPVALAIGSTGIVAVADRDNYLIRHITGGKVYDTAGTQGTSGNQDGTGSSATFSYLSGIAWSGSDLYVSQHGSGQNQGRIRLISSGNVSTPFTSLTPPSTINLTMPNDLTVDGSGLVYIANTNHNVITSATSTPSATLTNLVGVDYPRGIWVNSAGTSGYVSESKSNQRVFKLTKSGSTWSKTAYAGKGTAGYIDGKLADAQFNYPRHLAVNGSGVIFLVDQANNRIRMITPP